MSKLIIGLVGQAGCGKGTMADLLQTEYGAGYFRFSAILSGILDRLALEKTREHFTALSETLRKTFGEDVLSYAIANEALHAPQDVVILDGIRRVEDIVGLEPLPLFKLVAIDADPKLRYERMKNRGEKASEKNFTWEQFLAEEQLPTEVTIPFVMKRATKTLTNNGSREEFETTVHGFMSELGFHSAKKNAS